ncbi:MAG: hypothetical protein AAF288_13930 [Planctomycetota bacterium]
MRFSTACVGLLASTAVFLPTAGARAQTPDASVQAEPSEPAVSAPIRLEVSLEGLLQGPDPLITRLEDPVWQIEGRSGTWLQLPLRVESAPRSPSDAQATDPSPPRLPGARFVAWVLPDPAAAPPAFFQGAPGTPASHGSPGSPSAPLSASSDADAPREPTAAERLLDPVRAWAGSQPGGPSLIQESPTPGASGESGASGASGESGDAAQPPRLATRLQWTADGVRYPLDRAIRGLSIQSGSQPYLYKLDPQRLRDAAPERPELRPLERGASREERQTWSQNRTETMARFREESDAYARLRAAVQALPDPIQAPLPPGVWALYEFVGPAETLTLTFPLSPEHSEEERAVEPWSASFDDLRAWRGLALPNFGGAGQAGNPWAALQTRLAPGGAPHPLDQRLAVALLAQSGALSPNPASNRRNPVRQSDGNADPADSMDPERELALTLATLPADQAEPVARASLWRAALNAGSQELTESGRNANRPTDPADAPPPGQNEPAAWAVLDTLAQDAPPDARQALAAARLAAAWNQGPDRGTPDLRSAKLDAAQGLAAVLDAMDALADSTLDEEALRSRLAAFDPADHGWASADWADAYLAAVEAPDVSDDRRAALGRLLDTAVLPALADSDLDSDGASGSINADLTLLTAVGERAQQGRLLDALALPPDAALWQAMTQDRDPALRAAARSALDALAPAWTDEDDRRRGPAPFAEVFASLASSLGPEAPAEELLVFSGWFARYAQAAPDAATDALAEILQRQGGPQAIVTAMQDDGRVSAQRAAIVPLAAAVARLDPAGRSAALDAWAQALGEDPHPVSGLAADPQRGAAILSGLTTGAALPPAIAWARALDDDPERAVRAAQDASEADHDALAAGGAAARALLAGADADAARRAAEDWLAQPERQGPAADAWWAARQTEIARDALAQSDGAYRMTLQYNPDAGEVQNFDLGLARWSVGATGVVSLGIEGLSLRPVPGRLAAELPEPVALKNLPESALAALPLERASDPLRLEPGPDGVWAGTAALRSAGDVTLTLTPEPLTPPAGNSP